MRADSRGAAAPWHAEPQLWQALTALVAVALYARTVAFGWTFDDQMEIVRNVYAHSLVHVPDVFRTTVWTGSGMETYLYRPLVLVTYALNHAVSGLNAWSYHLVNVLLHAGASVLVFRVGRLWGLPVVAAGIGALLFAVHPVHVEVVANVAGRKDLLTTLFVLGMALRHRSALGQGGWRSGVPVLLYAGAVLTKEIGAMGLFLVAAQDAFLERDRRAFFNRPRVIGTYFAYMGVLAAFLLARVAVAGVAGVPDTFVFDNPLVEAAPVVRLVTALAVVGKGVGLLVAPLVLSPDYSFDAIPVVESVADLRLWVTAAGLAVVAWGLAHPGLRRTVLPLGAAWYALSLLPASNLLITVGTIFGERLLYLPSVAFCLLAGSALAWMHERRARATLAGVAVIAAAFSAQTIRYSGAWTDDVTLFEWATRSVPRSTKAHHKLGEEYLRVDRLGDALRSLERAVEIAPDNAFAAGTRARARRAVVERYAGGAEAVDGVEDPDVLYVLAQDRNARGDASGAATLWAAALAEDPDHASSLADLGALRLMAGDTVEALARLERAVAVDPGMASAWFNLAGVRLAQGRDEDAAAALRSFLGSAGEAYADQVAWAREALRRLGSR